MEQTTSSASSSLSSHFSSSSFLLVSSPAGDERVSCATFCYMGRTTAISPNISQTEPLMWQPSYVEAKGQLWSDIMPLSTSLVQREVIDDKTPPEPPRPSRNPFVVLPRIKTRSKHPPKIKVTEGMNIAVMIEMPQAPETLQDAEGVPEYQIGMLRVPWKDEMNETVLET
ncbi:hypothetical protein MVEN_00529500 [Mycena venus]|uniref:Uncharacterized protein n=1 Tax=Mycena venus TaxID=2733690 RepID=A0A8H6YQ17_9AGAR|nr:hypothetical protein MVEN_00529500 [Mycena venus]